MKATRKVIAALTTLALAATSVPFMVSADDLEVTYNAEASYTVTIPASVTLSATADVTADIKAEDVLLDTGQAISVKLQTASNTESGSTFNAKTADGASTANYTISAGETAISVGDEVANFDADGSQTLTFSKAEGATAAGSHTETLTFNISTLAAEAEEEESEAFFPLALKEGDVIAIGITLPDEITNVTLYGAMTSDSAIEFTNFEAENGWESTKIENSFDSGILTILPQITNLEIGQAYSITLEFNLNEGSSKCPLPTTFKLNNQDITENFTAAV